MLWHVQGFCYIIETMKAGVSHVARGYHFSSENGGVIDAEIFMIIGSLNWVIGIIWYGISGKTGVTGRNRRYIRPF